MSKGEGFDLIVYHANCMDGLVAAYVMESYGPIGKGCESVAAKYGDAPPDVTGKRVAIVDFSYPREVLLLMAEQAAELLVLDHHKTAAADLADLPFTSFDMDRSGARMAWDWCVGTHGVPEEEMPWFVPYVEDRDLWLFELPDSREINAGIRFHSPDLDILAEWDDDKSSEARMFEIGKLVLANERKQAEMAARRAVPMALGGYTAMATNSSILASEIGHILAKSAPVTLVYMRTSDQRWKCELRSAPGGPDVSKIAKEYGGGGHAHAAGFYVRDLSEIGLGR